VQSSNAKTVGEDAAFQTLANRLPQKGLWCVLVVDIWIA
jgi:hypothetical protein